MENDDAEPIEPSAEAEDQNPPALPVTEVKSDNTMGYPFTIRVIK